MRGRIVWIEPFAWMVGLAAATASTILLDGAIATAVGPPLFFRQLFTDPYLFLATVAHIGSAFLGGLLIAQGLALLWRHARNRSS